MWGAFTIRSGPAFVFLSDPQLERVIESLGSLSIKPLSKTPTRNRPASSLSLIPHTSAKVTPDTATSGIVVGKGFHVHAAKRVPDPSRVAALSVFVLAIRPRRLRYGDKALAEAPPANLRVVVRFQRPSLPLDSAQETNRSGQLHYNNQADVFRPATNKQADVSRPVWQRRDLPSCPRHNGMDSSTNHRGWAERTGEFSPAYYAHLGPNKVSKSLVTLLEYYSTEEASILELGCSSGRHLAYLHENGFENLTGIDINDESFEVMAKSYPDLADTGTFHTGSIERLVSEFADNTFDVVYSVETLQHVHADDEWVFEEIGRITRDLLVTIENEGTTPNTDQTVRFVNGEFPLYCRNWNRVFTDLGLSQLLSKPGKPDTIRAFRPSSNH